MFGGVWQGIQTVLGNALNLIGTLVTNFIPTAIGKLTELGGAFIGWVGKDVLPFIGDKLAQIASALWTWITNTAKDALGKAAELGRNVIDGIVNGLKAAGDAVKNFLLNLMSGAVDAVKNFFGIKSPSTLMAGIGQDAMAGFGIGLGKGTPAVVAQAGRSADAISGALANVAPGSAAMLISGAATGAGLAVGEPVVVNIYLDSKLISQALASRQNSRQAIPSTRAVAYTG